MGGGEIINLPKRPGEPDCTWADISKVSEFLGWKPQIDLKEGVGKMLDNLEYWSDAPLWDEKSISTATKKWFEYLS